jgi:hypothetical protein
MRIINKISVTVLMLAITSLLSAQTADKKETLPVSDKGAATKVVLPGGNTSDPVIIKKEEQESESAFKRTMNLIGSNLKQSIGVALETFLPFQFKYAIMLNERVEKLTNVALYSTIDKWYGTRYRYGGTTTKGIDCSAFMQVLGNYAFGWALPRTAREQYMSSEAISVNDLKEGDLVFFNTRGGVSHVGMYLQNDKFVHSSSSQGVTISNLSDSYWQARFIGARRSSAPEPKDNEDGVF